jgi:hypothetical protein
MKIKLFGISLFQRVLNGANFGYRMGRYLTADNPELPLKNKRI